MEVRLEDLIEKIRQEGVQEAKKKAAQITDQAQKQALQIVAAAKKEAAQIIEKAKNEAQKFENNAQSSIQHAGRDAILMVKEQLKELFERTLKKEVAKALEPDFIKSLIVKLVENIAKGQKLEIILSPQEREKLYDAVFSSLKTELRKSIVIKADARIDKGFRIGFEGEEAYYDLSEEGITEFFKQFLSAALSEIIERSNG